jgi:putative transposase
MLVLETKLRGNPAQLALIDEAIRTAQFIRNKCVRYWMDNKGVGQYDLSKLCAVLAKEFEWAGKLNSMARQASAERAWSAIKRFYDNCKAKKPGKKGFPKCFARPLVYKKNCRSVEYKTTGWKLSEDRKHLTFTDGFKAGTFLLMGADDLHFYQTSQIKRIRVVRKADGYYAQFCIEVDRQETIHPTGKAVGIDLGLKYFYKATDESEVENPKFLRKSEGKLKRLQRRVSKKQKGSKNRRKAINRLGRQHLKVSRQRKDWAVKQARALVLALAARSALSSDFIAYENLQVRNMVRNHHLAKSISDAAWGLFVDWVKYYAQIFGKVQQPVPPQNTTIDCFDCKQPVQKTLSTRTHVCPYCGSVRCRDENAAWNILEKGLRLAGINTVGHTGMNASGQNDLYLNQAMGLDKSAG